VTWRRRRDDLLNAQSVAVGAGLLLALVVGVLVTSGSTNVVILVGCVPIAVAVVWISPRQTLYSLVVWTVALGLVRRLVPSGANSGFSGDPLLLIAPLVLVLLLVLAVIKGDLRARSPLAIAVTLLALLGIVEAANPLQGGLRVGLGGILYVVVPMLAFWIGRAFLDDRTLRHIMWIVAILAAFNAFYGLIQTLAGFPSWDLRWIQSSGYAALNVYGSTRAFGSFSSAQEYSAFLSIGLVCWLALARRGSRSRIVVAVGAVALIGTALVLDSQRSAIVLVVVALGVMVAARTGRRLGGAALFGAAVIALLVLVAGQVAGSGSSSTTPTYAAASASSSQSLSALTGHLFSGLASPTGKQSTLSGHVSETEHGIAEAFIEPLGHGTGAVTVAAQHFSTDQTPGLSNAAAGTEDDPGNAGVAFGIAGLLLYLVIAVRGLGGTYGLARERRDVLGLAAMGLLVVTFLQWLNGDLYSVTWLVWLTLGWVDRQSLVQSDQVGEVRKLELAASGLQ